MQCLVGPGEPVGVGTLPDGGCGTQDPVVAGLHQPVVGARFLTGGPWTPVPGRTDGRVQGLTVETAASVVERGLRVERPLQPHPAGTDAILQLHGPQSAEAFGQATQPRHQLGIEITAEVSRDLVPVAPQCRNKFASRGHPVTVDD